MHDPTSSFESRHLGLNAAERRIVLDTLGLDDPSELLEAAVPGTIRQAERLSLPEAGTETEVLARLQSLADANEVATSLIGMGWNDCVTPPVILRNILEDPAWYTAYTPYQPEISQGRLELLLTFQTMVADLTGCEVANASMLDEATAAAEAMTMLRRLGPGGRDRFFVDADCHPQTIAVVRTRAEPLGIEIEVGDPTDVDPQGLFGALLAYPGSSGTIRDVGPVIEAVHAAGGLVAVTTDLLACCLLRPPGELGADAVVGSAQRFGVPLGFGGPHAGFLATRASSTRSLPGRLVGVSVDRAGRPAYRLALQTREQHIRREKATSNICTAQVLLANIAAAYAAWHGAEGLTAIARRVHRLTAALADALTAAGLEVLTPEHFDTLTVRVPGRGAAVVAAARDRGLNLRPLDDDHIGLSLDETSSSRVVDAVLDAFGVRAGEAGPTAAVDHLPEALVRQTPFLQHPTFSRYRTEHEMLRWLRRLADRDLALDRTMIPLGSCTMKLNATAEMLPITWPGFARMHPYAPAEQTAGYRRLIDELSAALCEITGYDAVSLQPNAGSQGEYAGLLAIRAWHRSRGEGHRDVCLIPSSAHGTNAASAVLAGMRVIVVACDDDGNVDLDDLRRRIAQHGDDLAAIMITYPSTHGVYEATITELCALVHDAGGQVYTDGANLNALVGVARPGRFGSDVSHLNLHKTFCIPHGGGGPGVGPVAVRSHLAPFLPNHPVVADAGPETGPGPVSAAPWGSAGILPISLAYIWLMGPDGLRRATEGAVLAANYVARRLAGHYPILYSGPGGWVAHECIVDLRPLTKASGITVDDVAKRLADYGFHAPTMSFPVAGTLMIEPTESESLAELDRFCDAMIAIRAEIDEVASGSVPVEASVLRQAPHTAEDLLVDEWDRPYTRARAAFPLPGTTTDKYFPPVGRIDQAYGDRNLSCACPPVAAFAGA